MKIQFVRRLLEALLRNLSKMSQTPENYWGEFILDIPLGIFLIVLGLRHVGANPNGAIVTMLAGLFLFSFIEYAFHRWLFHGAIQLMAKGHRTHHENPLGYAGLPFFLPALILMGLLGISTSMMPVAYALLLIGAIACGYTIYGLGHFAIHHVRFRRNLTRRWAANHHIHHYHPEANFGVTTPLWDMIFNTQYKRP